MKNSYLLIVILFMTSCATLINKQEYPLEIRTNINNSKVQLNDTTYDLPATIKIRRSKSDLVMTLLSDTLRQKFIVKSSPNGAFLYGNLIWAEFCPIAYLIDYSNSKRFYYGKSVYLNVNNVDSIIIPKISKAIIDYRSKIYPTKAGQINLVLSIPYANSFYLQPPLELTKTNTGFWGCSVGIEYYYKDNKYLNFSANRATDFFLPVIGAIDIEGEYDMMSTSYVSLTNNYKFKRFTIGYGINYSTNTWDHRFYGSYDDIPPLREPIRRVSKSFGITLNGYHQVSKHFFVGAIYRPTFLRIKPELAFKYEHLISLDFAYKFKIKK